MKKLRLLGLVSFLFLSNVCGQNKSDLHKLKTEFQTFNYVNVINIANKLLSNQEQFSEEELIEIYLLKGISNYSLGKSDSVKTCFYEILNLDSNYIIDANRVSPKIINEFKKLKVDYKRFNLSRKVPSVVVKPDTLYKIDTLLVKTNTDIYSSSVMRSLVLPGWGHLYSGHKTKGWLLVSASTITLGSMFYYISDASNKRSNYINELDPNLIDKKYSDYNTSYKIRNTLIATYAVIWIYSQIDILFVSELSFTSTVNVASTTNLQQYTFPRDIELSLSFQF